MYLRRLHALTPTLRSRRRLTVGLVLLALLVVTPAIVANRTWFIEHPIWRPTATSGRYQLEVQTEGFTCGLHAVSTVYRAYGLDAESEQVRRRLGVDVKALNWMPDSTGAMHPDMYMVLSQDGFAVDAIEPTLATAWEALTDHLRSGHPAILLIRRRESGGMHWVVATRAVGSEVEVYDSLLPTPIREPQDYLHECVVSVIAVRPLDEGEAGLSSIEAHRSGALAATAAAKRMVELARSAKYGKP